MCASVIINALILQVISQRLRQTELKHELPVGILNSWHRRWQITWPERAGVALQNGSHYQNHTVPCEKTKFLQYQTASTIFYQSVISKNTKQQGLFSIKVSLVKI